MPSNWLVFDRIRALTRQHRIYRFERVFQDQSQLDRLSTGGDFLDLNQQSVILDQTNLQINRLERYKDYEQMDQTGEISLALDLYADEASLVDPERKHTLVIRAKSRRLKKELEELFFNTLQWDTYCRPSVRYLCKYGDLPYEVILDSSRGSVASLKFMNVYNFTRIETRHGDLIGFFYMDTLWPRPQFLHPWQVMHLRLTSFENIYHPYGRCSDVHSKILVPNGYKELRDVKKNDIVYSFNGVSVEPTRVLNMVCSGKKPSVRIKTKYRDLIVSEDHPILAVIYGENGRPFRRYVPAKHVVPGSVVTVHDPEYDDINSYMTEAVTGVVSAGDVEVGDIQVESGHSNFIANGMAIHNCIKVGTPILTPSGYKSIEDFKPGDDVYAYDGDGLVSTKVIAAAKTGVKFTKIIRTSSHTVQASLDHLCLCLRDGKEQWIQVSDLVVGDLLVAPRPEPTESLKKLNVQHDYVRFNEAYFSDYKKVGIGYKLAAKTIGLNADCIRGFIFRDKSIPIETATTISKFYNLPLDFLPGTYGTTKNNVNIPEYTDEDFVMLFGFLLGDGWLTDAVVEIALGNDEEINVKYVELLENYGQRKCTIRRQNGRNIAAIMNSTVLTNLFAALGGLNHKCYDKYIPNWCFDLPSNLKVALIQGLLDSDGCVYFDRKTFTLRYISSSKRLAVGLQILLTHLGHKFSNIYERLNYKFNNMLEFTRPVYSLTFYQSTNYGAGQHKRYVRIKSIADGGVVETADIQVDHPASNFVAGGIIVHNSILDGGRKAFKQLRLMEDSALIYRICLRGDSLVWTPTGHTPIKDLKIGDEIYCFKDGQPKVTKVVDWQCNGNDVIYRVYSQHREIFCNATHPILVETSYSNKRDKDRPARLEYVDVKDIIVKRNGIASHHRFILPQVEYKQYVKLNCEALIAGGKMYENGSIATGVFIIPDVATEDFARWFGFMIGDGFISRRLIKTKASYVSEVGFATGDDALINDTYARLFASFVGKVNLLLTQDRKFGRYSINSKPFYDFMIDNGFIPGAGNKRIPGWVYQSPREVQEAFIDGYIDADGHRRMCDGGITESCEIDCGNEMLLRDLKELCHRLGWNVGLVRKHERTGGYEIGPGRLMPGTTAWALYFTKSQLPEPEYAVKAGERCSNSSEGILGVEEVGEDLVYDITVEDECHNFIVHGCPIMNTRAPEKRKFTIPVGLIPPKEVPEYMQMIARNFKRQRFYNPSTGTFDERYSPLIQEDDFFLPRRPDGTGPDIDVLPGGENVDKIADIEYFKKKMIAPMKIPFARVGIGEGSGEASEKSLSQTHSEFAKAVQWVQREVSTGLTKVAIIHLALRGYPVDDLKGFEIALTASSAMEELYRIETWQTRAGVMADLKDLGWFPKEWIVTHFTDLSPDEIEELKDMEVTASEGGGGGGGIGGGLDVPESPSPAGAPGTEGIEPNPTAEAADMMGMQQESRLPGLDWRRQVQVLKEMAKDGKKEEMKTILERWAMRLGKLPDAEPRVFYSGFQNILESKELDGLSVGKRPDLNEGEIFDPNSDPNHLLVAWSVPQTVRDEVIKEVCDVITAGGVLMTEEQDGINEADLPVQVSSL